jgi:hypothetical protein
MGRGKSTAEGAVANRIYKNKRRLAGSSCATPFISPELFMDSQSNLALYQPPSVENMRS